MGRDGGGIVRDAGGIVRGATGGIAVAGGLTDSLGWITTGGSCGRVTAAGGGAAGTAEARLGGGAEGRLGGKPERRGGGRVSFSRIALARELTSRSTRVTSRTLSLAS